MRKYSALVGSFAVALLLFLLLPSTANAAAAAGPVGSNGLRAYLGPGTGEITLEWSRVSTSGENYSVYYGTASKVDQFIAPYVGYIATYTVRNLTPGQRYYFRLHRIWTGNVDVGYDGEVSAVAPRNPTTVVINGPVGRNFLTAVPGAKRGTVHLAWKRFFNDTELYNIVYGLKPGQFIYGVLNAVDTTPADPGTYTYDIGALQSGRRYYFAVVPQRGGQAIYVTSEVSAIAR